MLHWLRPLPSTGNPALHRDRQDQGPLPAVPVRRREPTVGADTEGWGLCTDVDAAGEAVGIVEEEETGRMWAVGCGSLGSLERHRRVRGRGSPSGRSERSRACRRDPAGRRRAGDVAEDWASARNLAVAGSLVAAGMAIPEEYTAAAGSRSAS